MNKEYDNTFQIEIERILDEVYNHPRNIGDTKIKRAVVETEKRYIDYLIRYNLISNLHTASGGKFGIQLENNGFEVFEKYKGWDNYKRKVIDRRTSIEKAKEMSVKYWWIPIIISLFSITISIIALFK
ncbi:MAG: hypothetical protein PHI42_05085 [Paludibacteraceae bacterium]|nr:hypothetical protein [Paludibacteraceae bacterium]